MATRQKAAERTGPTPAAVAPAEVVASGWSLPAAWPLRLSIGLPLTLLLIPILSLPIALTSPSRIVLISSIVPLFAVAIIVRLVFQALAVGDEVVRLPRRAPPAALCAAALGLGCVVCIGFILGGDVSAPGSFLALAGVTAVNLTAAGIRMLEMRLGAANRRLFFIGSEEHYRDLRSEVLRRGDMRIVGRLSLQDARLAVPLDVAGSIIDAHTTTLVMSGEAIADEALVSMALEVHRSGVRVRALTDFYEQNFGKVALTDLTESWFFFDVAEIHRPRLYGAMKRCWETALSAFLLTASIVIVPFIAVGIRLSGPGPILHRQRRVGKGGREIQVVKFRTMVESDAHPSWATQELARVTGIGRLLRKYRLDEIPQLWNVIRGDLALVGPRPEQPHIVERLQHTIDFYNARHQVRPGVTGWAQVNHGYGGSIEGTLAKLQYEFFYLKRQGLKLDLLVVFETIRIVLSGRGT
jgi:lipopolysaccharide/colanic/teichoic acid biosynthesis glycosyltransferase